ncbi:hypothetical protein SAMN02745126_03661 [Enhydrobacter aerosaccus]|uniref:PXPV repeat-containing protein n=1 Tax=Enhydrobacter aerosaccus TaxID=225324 RepID=A0A1T4R814_9HYPH|nr:hypothetical protein [Enhydrobacter aerosaccus]SKA12069.1 hypothetical protein SAMN02745126_03661 [Enhydrobacter aerosaccus]
MTTRLGVVLVLAVTATIGLAGQANARWWGDGQWHDDDRWHAWHEQHEQREHDPYYRYNYQPPPVVYGTPYNYGYAAPPVIYGGEPGLNIHIGP